MNHKLDTKRACSCNKMIKISKNSDKTKSTAKKQI